MSETKKGMDAAPQRVHFVLAPEFSFIALAAVLDPLRIANRFGGKLYEWVLVGEKKGAVQASNGILVHTDCGIDEVDRSDLLIICASFNPKKYQSPKFRECLRRLDRQGTTLGSIDTGIYFLADAGLIGAEKVTLHWEQIPCYCEDYPGANISNDLFEIAPRRMYCAGGAAGIDMMLDKIMREHGRQLALDVSEQFVLSRLRTPSEHQRLELSIRHNVYSKRLAKAIMLMESNIENPAGIDDVAAAAHVSRRQLERLFKASLGETPTHFYLGLRLKRAQALLRETNLSITEVSIATGFDSVTYFSRTYRSFFKQTPRCERDK